ncbi:LppX_LprAFG lipoprotein [Spongisporangium articulatum]|uniref:LppX_LprAFG lipoprotein n=1 Tax=Spongisporangium articulatum TaxID=3362603 RepID=A0ABW8AMB7_9ACTN
MRFGRLCAGAVALCLALAACGGAQGGSAGPAGDGEAAPVQLSPAQLVSAATDKAQGLSTARFTMKVATQLDTLNILIDAAGRVDTSTLSLVMTSKVRFGGDTLYMHKRVVDGIFFVEGLPDIPGWVRVDPDDLAGGLHIGLDLGQASDPTGMFALISALSEDVHEAGGATVRGEHVTRYTGTLNVAKAIGAAPSDSDPLRKLEQQARSMGFTTAPFTVYVDDRGLPARVQLTMTSSGTADSLVSKVTTTQDYYDWGVPVTVRVPAGAKPMDQPLDLLK